MREHFMSIRKTVTFVEEINSEYGTPASPPLRRVAIAAVFKNPLAGKAAGADLKPLIDYSLELGASLTKTALTTLGATPTQLRAYTKAAVVGVGGDLEHGAAMIHPRLGMAMRRAIKRGRVIIPGHAKVGPPGTTVDLIYGPLDDGWDLDAFDSTPGTDPRRAAPARNCIVDRLRHRSARQRPLQGSGSEGSRCARRFLCQQQVKWPWYRFFAFDSEQVKNSSVQSAMWCVRLAASATPIDQQDALVRCAPPPTAGLVSHRIPGATLAYRNAPCRD
jgi:hypothetical protein